MVSDAKVSRLLLQGFTPGEVMKLTGLTTSQFRYCRQRLRFAAGKPIEEEARRMLYKVPKWWTKTNEEWRACVRANFADVLEGPKISNQSVIATPKKRSVCTTMPGLISSR